MQRNFTLFLVIAFAILIGWVAVIDWLTPRGYLTVEIAEGAETTGAMLRARSEEHDRELPLDKSAPHQLPPGTYDLSIEGNADKLRVEPAQITIEQKQFVTATVAARPVVKPKVAEDKKPGPKIGPEKPDVAKNDKPPKVEPTKAATRQRRTLGSVDPESPYQMLVVFDSRGAAVERIELASPRFHDWENRTGYLGQLAPTDVPGGKGVLVGIVGPGSPAAEAGIRQGDIITAIEEEPVAGTIELQAALARTTPKDTLRLSLLRGTEKLAVTAKLTRHPMQIVRPEIENSRLRRDDPPRGENDPPSLLFTLLKVDDEQIGADGDEIPGVRLRDDNWEIVDNGPPDAVTFRAVLPKHGLEIRKTYQLARTGQEDPNLPDLGYHLNLSVEVRNVGATKRQVAYRLDGPTGLPTEGAWYVRTGLRDFVVGLWNQEKETVGHHVVTTAEITSKPQENSGIRDDATGEIRYIGVNTQYFAGVLLPRQRDIFQGSRPVAVGEVDEKRALLTNVTVRLTTTPITLEPGKSLKHDYALFAGPKVKETLAAYALDPLVDYGWWIWAWIARLLQQVLHIFYSLVGNYGLAIIMLTVLVRLAMFPLSRKQVQGAQKMQELQPEIKRISEQYKKNLEARNRALGELFRKHQYHPLSGCLPIFVQLPVFIGLYNSLSVDIKARDAALFSAIQWCSNLAAPDMLHDWSAWMPAWVQNGAFIFPGLGPFLNVLPIITVALFIIQQKMFMPPPTNEQQAMQQKLMKYMMVIIGVMFYKVAAGLCLYFIASSLWGLAERKLMPKTATKVGESAATTAPASPTTNGSAAARRKKKKQQRRER